MLAAHLPDPEGVEDHIFDFKIGIVLFERAEDASRHRLAKRVRFVEVPEEGQVAQLDGVGNDHRLDRIRQRDRKRALGLDGRRLREHGARDQKTADERHAHCHKRLIHRKNESAHESELALA
ncbi:MAG: hypothetical protein KAI97_02835 [Gemmatimonadetes bacterium]|nr:hypothetical protein [Gemmatimonadota bacterium]